MTNPFEVIENRLSNIESLLLDLKNKPGKEEESPIDVWFDVSELCNYLPDKPMRATVYGWVHAGLIPVHKGSKKLRFLKSEIDAFLKSGKRKTISETDQEANSYLQKSKNLKS